MDSYKRSKIPLKLVLIAAIAILLNGALVLGVQLLVTYRFTGPIDSEILGKMDSSYENCVFLDRTEENTYGAEPEFLVYLVENPDGSLHLVTLQKHYLFDRYRIVKSACTELDPELEKVRLRAGITSFTLGVTHNEVSGRADIHWKSSPGLDPAQGFRNTMFLSIAALCAVELVMYGFLFKREEIA